MKRIILFALIIVDILIIAAIAWCLRETKSGSSQMTKWRKMEGEIRQLETAVKSFDEQKLLAEHGSFIKRVPTNNVIPITAMKKIQDMAQEEKIAELRFTYDEKQVHNIPGIEDVRVIPFKVYLRGTYESVTSLIQRLLSSDILMTVIDVTMQRQGAVPVVDARATVHTFTILSK